MTRLFTITFDLSTALVSGIIYACSCSRRTFFRRHARQACQTRPPAGSEVSGAFGPAPPSSSAPGADIDLLSFGENLSNISVCMLHAFDIKLHRE